MTHIINTHRVLTLAAALAVAASASLSCAKQEADGAAAEGSIGYSASIDGTKVISDNLIENLDKLKGKGFSVSAWYAQNGAQYFSGDKVSWNGSEWTSKTSDNKSVTRLWPADVNGLKFLAATPAAALNATVDTNVSASKWTYTHTVGETPAADDLLFGYYKGNKEGRTVDLTFHHPLALLDIRCGSKVTGISSISKVSISGVYASGTYTMNYGANPAAFTWTPSGTQTVTKTTSLGTFTERTLIGESMPLIPQAFSSGTPVAISLQVTGLDDAHKTFVCTLNASTMGSLAAGNRTTVSINIENADKITFEVGVTEWGTNTTGTAADAEPVYGLSFEGVTLDGWQEVNDSTITMQD